MKLTSLNISLSKGIRFSVLIAVSIIFMLGCQSENQTSKYMIEVYQTSAAGDNLKLISKEDQSPTNTNKATNKLVLNPNKEFQEYYGFGASFTESSAWNLATIPVELRKEVLTKLLVQQKVQALRLQELILIAVIILIIIIPMSTIMTKPCHHLVFRKILKVSMVMKIIK